MLYAQLPSDEFSKIVLSHAIAKSLLKLDDIINNTPHNI